MLPDRFGELEIEGRHQGDQRRQASGAPVLGPFKTLMPSPSAIHSGAIAGTMSPADRMPTSRAVAAPMRAAEDVPLVAVARADAAPLA